MKTALIKQPIGIGDVFYLQKFAYIIKSKGYNIIWPLREDILWIANYISGIDFCSLNDNFFGIDAYYSGHYILDRHDLLFLSPDGFRVPGRRIMESKYLLINESDHDWFDYFIYSRNKEKEDELYYDVLNLKDEEEFIFVNKMASVDVRKSDVLDDLIFDTPIIELQLLDGFSMIDWCKVLENAKEIHTVHTGINYLIDTLPTKAIKYNMYQGLHHSDVQFIPFRKKPNFIAN
jgi:hypothetical protein